MLLCLLGEGDGGAAGGLDEEVEGAVGLGHLVAESLQTVGKEPAVFVIGGEVGAQFGAPGDDLLHQAGGADVTAGAGSTGNGGVQSIVVGAFLGNIDIADALAGEAQALAPGVADDGVVIDAGDPGGGDAAVDQLPVGLVGDDVDGLAELLALARQQLRELAQGLGGVDRTGGVIGGIEDDGLNGDGGVILRLARDGDGLYPFPAKDLLSSEKFLLTSL